MAMPVDHNISIIIHVNHIHIVCIIIICVGGHEGIVEFLFIQNL